MVLLDSYLDLMQLSYGRFQVSNWMKEFKYKMKACERLNGVECEKNRFILFYALRNIIRISQNRVKIALEEFAP